MDTPFYLFKILGKMVVKVQSKGFEIDRYIFHFGLIKLLVLEELEKMGTGCNTFLFFDGYELEVMTPTPRKNVLTNKRRIKKIALRPMSVLRKP